MQVQVEMMILKKFWIMKINILIYILILALVSCKNNKKHIKSGVLGIVEDSFLNKVTVKDGNGVEMMIYLDSLKRNIQEIKVYQHNKYIGFYYLDKGRLNNSENNKEYFINHNFKAIVAPYIYEKQFKYFDNFSITIDSLSKSNASIPDFSEYEKKVMFNYYLKKGEPIHINVPR